MALWALQRVGAIKHLENSSPAHQNHSQLSLSLSLNKDEVQNAEKRRHRRNPSKKKKR